MRFLTIAIPAAIAGAALGVSAQAPQVLNCHNYAQFAANVAVFREVGAPIHRVLAYIRAGNEGSLLAVMEREVKLVYAEKRKPSDAAFDAFKRCEERLGVLEEGEG